MILTFLVSCKTKLDPIDLHETSAWIARGYVPVLNLLALLVID